MIALFFTSLYPPHSAYTLNYSQMQYSNIQKPRNYYKKYTNVIIKQKGENKSRQRDTKRYGKCYQRTFLMGKSHTYKQMMYMRSVRMERTFAVSYSVYEYSQSICQR